MMKINPYLNVHKESNCPLCHSENISFKPLPEQWRNSLDINGIMYKADFFETLSFETYFCDKCGSTDRERLYALFFESFLKNNKKSIKLLHFAPEPILANFLRKYEQIDYRSADLFMKGVDDKVDITNMKIYQDNSYDFIICSHILEHIPEDKKALNEIHRVLKKGAMAILMVPIMTTLEHTYEDLSITDPDKRALHFGQDDHVRVYAKNEYIYLLKNSGFKVHELDKSYFDAKVLTYFGIDTKSVLYVVEKIEKPILSVLMITYNHEKYLKKAIDSVLMQETDFRFELVIGDDASTDGTTEIVLEYAKKYPDIIKVHTRKENYGVGKNYRDLYNRISSKYIAILEGDDFWTDSHKLQFQVDYLENNLEITLHAHYASILKNNEVEGIYPDIKEYPQGKYSVEDIVQRNFLVTASVVYKNNYCKLPETFNQLTMVDWIMHMMYAHDGSIFLSDKNMAIYRIHDASVWSSKDNIYQTHKTVQSFEVFMKMMDGKIPLLQHELAKFQATLLLEDIAHKRNLTTLAMRCIKYIENLSGRSEMLHHNMLPVINKLNDNDLNDVAEEVEKEIVYKLYQANLLNNVSSALSDKKEIIENHDNPKYTIAYIANPLDINKYKELTLGILSPISRMRDYAIEQLIDLVDGKFKINQEVLKKCSMIIVFDKGAIYSDYLKFIKELDIPLVFYVSSNVWDIPHKHEDYEKSLSWQSHYAKTVNIADEIIVANEYINCKIPRKTTVLTPFIEASFWEKSIIREENTEGKLSVVAFVDPNSLSNLKLILEPIKSLQKRYDESVEFSIYAINCNPDTLSGLDFPNIKVALSVINTYIDYLTFVRSKPADIVLCPLLMQAYSIVSSPFLYFENALSNLPGIYSSSGLYRETVKHNKTGLLVNDNPKSWEDAMVLLINDVALREQITENANSSVREQFTIATHLKPMQAFLSKYTELSSNNLLIPTELAKSFTRYDISSLEVYQEYIKKKAFKEFDGYLWENLAKRWHIMVSFIFFVEIPFLDQISIEQLANTIESLEKQIYPEWKLYVISPHSCVNVLFVEAEALQWIQSDLDFYEVVNDLIPTMSESFVGILHSGDELSEDALAVICDCYNDKAAMLIYSDHDNIDLSHTRNFPKFKPDLNLEMLRASNYIERAFMVHVSKLIELNGFNTKLKKAELYDLLLRFIDQYGEQSIFHCAQLLYMLHDGEVMIDVETVASKLALTQHIQRNNLVAEVIDGEIERTYRILYYHEDVPLVSILIPTKNQYKYIKPCIETILNKTSYSNFEIIIVDNASDEEDAVEYIESLEENEKIHIIRYDKPFNYSTVNNVAASQAKGDYLLLLNNDTEIFHDNWLNVMMSHAQRDEVGIVGARLLYANGSIQHAGVIVGLSTVADHQFSKLEVSDEGYMFRLQLEQELSAVTAAALLVTRAAFNSVDGLNDIDYKINFSDIDFCLKVREAGYKVIWTPHVTLMHHGSVTQKNHDTDKIKARNKVFESDKKSFIKKWKKWILHDPAFNINLDVFDYYMNTRINALPHWNIDQKSPIPRVFAMARDFDGGGYYRLLSPLEGLQDAGYIQFSITYKAYQPGYINHTQPDVIVYQTPLHDGQINSLKYMKEFFPHVVLIYEIDDLLTNIPIENKAFYNQYKDSSARIKRALQYCDKMVVSTQPLAEAFSKYSDNIRVIPNYLSRNIWGNLVSLRNQSEKLRVGWAGSMFHKGDLQIIKRLIIDFKDTVQWVFMGMAPEGLEDEIEYHQPVALNQYPQKLASLNLDLALVPLEQNSFNEAKSNLRLLEFGILAWPVICTDIYPYQEAPVRRVKNRYKDWKKAFEEMIANPENLHKEGDVLKKWVMDNYILEDNLEAIAKLYLE